MIDYTPLWELMKEKALVTVSFYFAVFRQTGMIFLNRY